MKKEWMLMGDRGFDLFVNVFDALRPKCKLAVRYEQQNFRFLANEQKGGIYKCSK
jgi:hypothetical protein